MNKASQKPEIFRNDCQASNRENAIMKLIKKFKLQLPTPLHNYIYIFFSVSIDPVQMLPTNAKVNGSVISNKFQI